MGTRLLFLCLLSLSSVNGQSADAATPAGRVVVSGSVRVRAYGWDWFQADSGDNTYGYSGSILRVSISQSRGSWSWNAEFAAPILLGLPANPVASGAQGALGLGASYLAANHGDRNTAMIFAKQLCAQVRFGEGHAHSLTVGRFEFADGSEIVPRDATLAALKANRINQRVLGAFGWSDVGRSFDGVRYSYARPSGNFTVVGAVPTRGVYQVDGWGWNRAVFGYASYTKPWGRGTHTADTRAFALYYDDFRPVLKTDNRPLTARRADLANLRILTFGGHSVHAFSTSAGTVDVLVWGAGQTGRWGTQTHRAHAIDAEAGIQPKLVSRVKPWLRAGFYDGSGDGNPNDNLHETFFQVLPTPRPFARFPFFNMMNNRDWFGMLTLRPHKNVTVSSEFHALRLSNANDLWYLGGGVYQPWTFGYVGRATGGKRSLANLYDSSLEVRVNRRATLTGYFGYAQGRSALAAIYPRGKDGQFGYLEALYKF